MTRWLSTLARLRDSLCQQHVAIALTALAIFLLALSAVLGSPAGKLAAQPSASGQASGLPRSQVPSHGASLPIRVRGCHIVAQTSCNRARLDSVNLGFVDLAGASLASADLSASNLTYANLSGADLLSADLHAADLTRANLSGADLANVNLADATLTGTVLVRANLHNAYLTHADLSLAKLDGANLRGASLAGVVFCLTVMPNLAVRNPGCR